MKTIKHLLLLCMLTLGLASCKKDNKEAELTGISIDPPTAQLTVDGTAVLTVKTNPGNMDLGTVSWSSSNAAIATIENGKVTAKAAGEATITATAKGHTATAKITVSAKPVTQITFEALLALNTGTSVRVPDGTKIKGVVISDASAKNTEANIIVLQEATGKPGIIVALNAAKELAIGDEVEVNISNMTLAKANGENVLQNIPADMVLKTGTATVTARVATTDDVIKNAAAWNGTLVTINNSKISNGKLTGTLNVTDDKGTLKTKIQTGATFENKYYFSDLKTLTGIVRVSGTEIRVDLRTKNDLVKADGAMFWYTEDFQTGVTGDQGDGDEWNLSTGKWYDDLSKNWYEGITQKYEFATRKAGDAAFLQPDRKYLYLLYGGASGTAASVDDTRHLITTRIETGRLKGVKSISLKFAGSLDGKGKEFSPAYGHQYSVNIFLFKATPTFPIPSTTNITSLGQRVARGSFTESGVMNTLEGAVPDPATLTWTAEQKQFGTENPTFVFQFVTAPSVFYPIAIENISFGFTELPTWAQ